MSQFPKTNCQYGAPMGQREYGLPQNLARRSVNLFRVKLDSGGYDDGGAYWGISAPLFCATNGGGYRRFVRASNRAHAALLLNLPREVLKCALPYRFAFGRYSAELAFYGAAVPGWMVQEFGRYLITCADWADLCRFAQEKSTP